MTRPRRLKSARRKKEFLQTVTFFFVTVFSISGLLVYLWVYNEINLTIRDISALVQVRANLHDENELIKHSIRRLERVDRISAIARQELGMMVAQPESIIVFTAPFSRDNHRD